MEEAYRIVPLGDAALLVQFGNKIDDAVHAKVTSVFHQLQTLQLGFVTDVVPAYSSLAVYYDVLSLHTKEKSAFEKAKELLLPLLNQSKATQNVEGRIIQIPVCYAPRFALDIVEMAEEKKMPVEKIIQLHTAVLYRVYMIGFLPGFPYMGRVDSRLATPRKASPRKNIPAGSVGIAGEQTGIYPLSSPGGWNLIGRTPLPLFNKRAKSPVLLQPGDNVSFYSITEDEFENY